MGGGPPHQRLRELPREILCGPPWLGAHVAPNTHASRRDRKGTNMMRTNVDHTPTYYSDDIGSPHEDRLQRSLGMGPILYKELSHAVVGAAIEVHRRLGPGMLENTYQRALECELRFRRMPFTAQVGVPLTYRETDVGELVVDLIVDDKIIVELKAVEHYLPVHRAQVFSYLGATGLKLGLLINFNVRVLCEGVCRVVR
ncbi:hypothetical protein BH11MYX1_BH11MYX1_11830 [soil metagenome]